MKHLFSIAFCCVMAFQVQAQIPSYVPTFGLVGWWPFNGNAYDESGNGNHGTVNGATLAADRFGLTNRAYLFDGTSNYILIKDTNSLDLFNQFSLVGWFRTNNLMTFDLQTILGKGRSNNGTGYSLNYLNGSPNLAGTGLNDGISINTGIQGIIQNPTNWHFVATTYDGNQLKIFVDGAIVNSLQISLQLSNSSSDLFFGKELVSIPRFFSGEIDDIGIWNRPLSQMEISNLFLSSNLGLFSIKYPSNIKIFPNPTTGTISISSENNELINGCTIKIMNYLGELIKQMTTNQTTTSIEILPEQNNLFFFVEISHPSKGIIDRKKIILIK